MQFAQFSSEPQRFGSPIFVKLNRPANFYKSNHTVYGNIRQLRRCVNIPDRFSEFKYHHTLVLSSAIKKTVFANKGTRAIKEGSDEYHPFIHSAYTVEVWTVVELFDFDSPIQLFYSFS